VSRGDELHLSGHDLDTLDSRARDFNPVLRAAGAAALVGGEIVDEDFPRMRRHVHHDTLSLGLPLDRLRLISEERKLGRGERLGARTEAPREMEAQLANRVVALVDHAKEHRAERRWIVKE